MNSYIKTILLLGVLSVLLIFIGRIIGGQQGMIFALMFSLVMNVGSFFFSDKIALSMSRAKPLARNQNPELFRMVEELSHKIKIPMPKLYLTPDRQANAFATGRGPGHASVAVTQGILDVLSKDELKGVLAHELAHVKNRDILIATVAAVLASALSFMANMALWGGMSGGDDDDNRGGLFSIVLIILVPIAASLIQFAISRQREYGADDTGARTVGDGAPLAQALLAIDASAKRNPMQVNPALSSLYIGNPMGNLGRGMMKLFSTHPPVEDRVERLKKI